MFEFLFGAKRRKKSCKPKKRYNVPGSPCNNVKRKQCKATSYCNYVTGHGCRRSKFFNTLYPGSMLSSPSARPSMIPSPPPLPQFRRSGASAVPKFRGASPSLKDAIAQRRYMLDNEEDPIQQSDLNLDELLGISSFGKMRRRRRRRANGKIPAKILKLCKRLGIKTTRKVGRKRVRNTLKTLKQQIKRKMRN